MDSRNQFCLLHQKSIQHDIHRKDKTNFVQEFLDVYSTMKHKLKK